MPPSLRKACHACVSSKRKCNPQLPACERCLKKQISCIYDLEPIATSQTADVSSCNGILPGLVQGVCDDTQQFQMVYDSVSNAKEASASAMASGLGRDSPAAHPLLMADGETAIWLMKWFAQVAHNIQVDKPSPFVHTSILDGCSGISVALPEDCVIPDDRDVTSTLIEIHGLITATLQRLLLDKPSVKKELETETTVQCLFSITRALWSSADNLRIRHLSPCHAWRIAESIRRSMFAAIFIRGIWSVAVSGYCHYEPFLESLPFDPRAGLWEAGSEEEWDTMVKDKYQGNQTLLKSWREFTEGPEHNRLSTDEDGHFQRMLHVSFHGSTGIRYLEELDHGKGDREVL